MQLAQCEGQLRPFVVTHPPGTQALRVQAANGGQHTCRQLGAPHFHREHTNRQAGIDRHVLGDIQGKGRLTHRGSAGNNDQVARLETGGLLVEIDEAGRHPGNVRRVVAVVQFLNTLDHLGQQGIDVHEAFVVPGASFGDLENLGLGLIKQGFGVPTERIERVSRDLVGRCHQLAQDGPLTDDLGIATDIRSRRRIGCKFTEVG